MRCTIRNSCHILLYEYHHYSREQAGVLPDNAEHEQDAPGGTLSGSTLISRRTAVAALAAAALPWRVELARADSQLGDDGLYHEPWFLQSFLDLKEDVETARSAGKRLAVMWELRGCPYCRETHLVNFADPEITGYIRANFEVLQLNLVGARKVTDFDGKEFSEKELAERYAIRFTPTFQFFPAVMRTASPPKSRSRARWRARRAISSRRTSWRCSASCARRPMSAARFATT
jgi:hypothetical protein